MQIWSLEVRKPSENTLNCIGTTVTHGKGIAVITSVLSNSESEMGKIIKLLNKPKKTKKTPLQKMMKKMAKYLTITALIISIVVPLVGWLRGASWSVAILGILNKNQNFLVFLIFFCVSWFKFSICYYS